jgi:hypothetical protein
MFETHGAMFCTARIFFLKLQYYGFENEVLITAKKAKRWKGSERDE